MIKRAVNCFRSLIEYNFDLEMSRETLSDYWLLTSYMWQWCIMKIHWIKVIFSEPLGDSPEKCYRSWLVEELDFFTHCCLTSPRYVCWLNVVISLRRGLEIEVDGSRDMLTRINQPVRQGSDGMWWLVMSRGSVMTFPVYLLAAAFT